jgi:hypothetical protein
MGVPLLDMMRRFGWKTPEEALHYIETAERRKAAKRTAAKVAKIEKMKNRKGSASVKPKIPV